MEGSTRPPLGVNLSTMLDQRMVTRKEINTDAKTKNTKARKNFYNCIGNK